MYTTVFHDMDGELGSSRRGRTLRTRRAAGRPARGRLGQNLGASPSEAVFPAPRESPGRPRGELPVPLYSMKYEIT